MLSAIAWIVLTYLIASLPFGLIIARTACGIDPRQDGSRNIGATNVARLCGTKWGVLTLACDILKGYAPLAVAAAFSDSWLFLSLGGLAAITGHMHSVFLKFTGGKAVATTIGVFLALAPAAVLWAVFLCALVIAATGYVSLGSLTLAATLPVFVLVTGTYGLFFMSLVVTLVIFWKHRENIRRLARGEEKSWRKSKV